MKQELLNLLNSFIDSNKKINEMHDIKLYKDISDKLNKNQEYISKYILDLDEKNISLLLEKIEDEEERKKVLASVIYLKNLIEINEKEKITIPLSESQNQLLIMISNIIKEKVNDIDTSLSYELGDYVLPAKDLISRINNNLPVLAEDYNLVENIIYKTRQDNSDKLMDNMMTFLNNYNYIFLNSNRLEKENNDEQVLLDESTTSNNMVISETDIFTPKSFTFNASTTNNKELKIDIKNTNISEIINSFGIKEEQISPYIQSLISTINEKEFKKTYKYIINNLMEYINLENHNEIVTLLCQSDSETLKDDFNYLQELDLTKENIKDLLNRATSIFISKNRNTFKDNFELAISFGVKISDLIKSNITFFYNSYDYNNNKISILSEKGLPINKILISNAYLFSIPIDRILKNIEVLNNYGISLTTDENENLSVLANKNLINMLDFFIENGFSEYMVSGDNLKNIRSLIIKRIYYSFKNELNIWHENTENNIINREYEKYIKEERKSLTEEEINYLIADYDELEILEYGKRVVLFSDTIEAQIKRKYEFIFNKTIISRLKTFSIFKVLINHNINVREAMLYAAIYNTNLNENEYLSIKKYIIG